MSSSNGNTEPSESRGREIAQRVFAREFNDISYTFTEVDDDMAPNYGLLPTGEKINRIFVIGTLTETEDVGNDVEYWQGRIVDPTGTFYAYAGKFQPEAKRMLIQTTTPEYISVTGKPNIYETDDGTMNAIIQPEVISIVDEATRDRWVVETAKKTLNRIKDYDDEINDYARMVDEQYTTSLESYREGLIGALESLDDDDIIDEAVKDDDSIQNPEF